MWLAPGLVTLVNSTDSSLHDCIFSLLLLDDVRRFLASPRRPAVYYSAELDETVTMLNRQRVTRW